jgi:RIO kinase 1
VEKRLERVLDRTNRERELRKDVESKDRKTVDEVFDRPTLLALYKLISNGIVHTVDYPVSTGKEANVFHATDGKGKSIALKIFRVHTATTHAYLTYLQGDPRFDGANRGRRDTIHTWVKKEYKNLLRMADAGVPVPKAIHAIDNVLVMEFIGAKGTPAPMMREVRLRDPGRSYNQIIASVRKIVRTANLVHGDLSEYNILVKQTRGADKLYVIDVGQAVLIRHPMSNELLARDLKNLSRYFKKLGVDADPSVALKKVMPKQGFAREVIVA